jgi:Cu(I)/Ag(I) efflux system membrane fusion protein
MKHALKSRNQAVILFWGIFSLLIMAFIIPSCSTVKTAKGQKITTSFEVSGNCDMCKQRIESVLDKKGIYKAYYDLENHRLFIEYNSAAFSELQIHNMIAAVGHDTDKVKADDLVYENLPGCCKYRKDEKW